MTNNDGYFGALRPDDRSSEYNSLLFLINQVLAQRHHVALVQVKEVHGGDGALAPVGRLDVQPMVHQVDGQGKAVPHGVIYGLPYLRWQGGADAVIMDPKAGDIGLGIFADRDSSAVVATGAPALPGSKRQADFADGIYLGGLLNGVPSQFIQFNADGITIVSPEQVKLVGPRVRIEAAESVVIETAQFTMDATDSATITTGQFTVNGPSQFNGAIAASSTITAGGNITAPDVIAGGKSGATHYHVAQGATAPTTTPKP